MSTINQMVPPQGAVRGAQASAQAAAAPSIRPPLLTITCPRCAVWSAQCADAPRLIAALQQHAWLAHAETLTEAEAEERIAE